MKFGKAVGGGPPPFSSAGCIVAFWCARASCFLFSFFFCLNFRLPRSVLTTCRLRRIIENCGLVLMWELKCAPATLASRSDGVPQKKQTTRDGDGQRTGLLKRVRMLNTSEYDSGLEPSKKPKKWFPCSSSRLYLGPIVHVVNRTSDFTSVIRSLCTRMFFSWYVLCYKC